MTCEEIMNLDAEGIEKRNAEIKAEIEAATEQAQLDALVEERKALDEMRTGLTETEEGGNSHGDEKSRYAQGSRGSRQGCRFSSYGRAEIK